MATSAILNWFIRLMQAHGDVFSGTWRRILVRPRDRAAGVASDMRVSREELINYEGDAKKFPV
jgi:hypothetical protein